MLLIIQHRRRVRTVIPWGFIVYFIRKADDVPSQNLLSNLRRKVTRNKHCIRELKTSPPTAEAEVASVKENSSSGMLGYLRERERERERERILMERMMMMPYIIVGARGCAQRLFFFLIILNFFFLRINFYIKSARKFRSTWISIQILCCQIL